MVCLNDDSDILEMVDEVEQQVEAWFHLRIDSRVPYKSAVVRCQKAWFACSP